MDNKINIGCSGFTGRDWKENFYPIDLPSSQQLSFYSQNFNTLEVNSTFYRKPRESTLKRWKNETVDDFKFFIKIPKTISHLKKLENTTEESQNFCEYIANGLGEKLAGFLFQLPPSFHFSNENLKKVIENGNNDFVNVFEFRHQSWWNEEVFETLKENNIIFSGVNFPKNIPDDFICNNSEIIYYRLHGAPILYKSEYSEEFLHNLADEIKNYKQTVYILFNNTWGIAALKNAQFLKTLLE